MDRDPRVVLGVQQMDPARSDGNREDDHPDEDERLHEAHLQPFPGIRRTPAVSTLPGIAAAAISRAAACARPM
ncbi:hypothetical protein [Streptomyces sp. NPDC001594]|uniref:hypothetical protein n=1 Tax=Streptomyces sp. NPDC001594 TaxID=3364590 RepID=UPI003676EB52